MPFRVLIVEDNATARITLEKLLAQEGFNVQTAGTLKQGSEKLDGQQAVILDLDLPDGNGIELLKRIRKANQSVRVLVATASTDSRLLNEVERALPDALLRKPVDVRQSVNLLAPLDERPDSSA